MLLQSLQSSSRVFTTIVPWGLGLAFAAGLGAYVGLVIHELERPQPLLPITVNCPTIDLPTHEPAVVVMAPGDRPARHDAMPDRVTLDRQDIEQLKDGGTLSRFRVVPSVEGEQVKGLKLYGIRKASLPERMGFRNGDMLVSIAKQSLTSVDAAMTASTAMSQLDAFDIVYQRAGIQRTLHVEIR